MDFRYAFRALVKSPGFAVSAVCILALGIALNTVVFTFYESVVWKPLPVRAPGEIVRVSGQHGQTPLELFSYSEYTQLRDANRSFVSAVATSEPQSLLAVLPGQSKEDALLVQARFVSGNYFPALGVAPVLGRAFEEGEPGVVVSHSLWKGRLRGDASAVGRTAAINGVPFAILGVAPESFAGTGLPPQEPDLWIPASAEPQMLPHADWLHDAEARQWQILARRRGGVSPASASAELDTLAAAWTSPDGMRTRLSARQASFFQPDSGEFEVFTVISRALMVAVFLILLLGCVNLVNLLLARGVAREREIAVRKALGAGRLQIVRQLCAETLLLGAAGGGLGLVLSIWSAEWIRVAVAAALQRIASGAIALSLDVSPDWRILAYSIALSLVTGALVGLWPAVYASRTNIGAVLKQEGAAIGRGFWSSRNILLTSQVTACLVLLAGAGILFRGAWRSRDLDPMFDSAHIFLVRMNTTAIATTEGARRSLVQRLTDRIANIQGVVSVAQAEWVPFLGHGAGPFENGEQSAFTCLFNSVSRGYFETLGIPLLAGRDFTLAETEREEPVVIVSESAARALWPGKDPLGQRVSPGGWLRQFQGARAYTVVGVAKTVRSTYLSKLDAPFVYFPKASPGDKAAFPVLLVRSRSGPEATMRQAGIALAGIDPNLPATSTIVTLEQGPVQIQRLYAEAPALVSSILGLIALLSAGIGIFGTVAFLVARRTREIGVRIALGARSRDVIRMVLGQGLRSVAWGSALGLAGALGISSLLSAMVVAPDLPDLTYGAGAFNAVTFLGVLGGLAAVALIASLIPVVRATRVDPAAALRDA